MSPIRVCVIGNSHTAAIKSALSARPDMVGEAMSFDYFASGGNTILGLRREGRSLVAGDGDLQRTLERNGSPRSIIEIDAYDVFVLVGMGLSHLFTLRVAHDYATRAHAEYVTRPYGLSEACFRAAIRDRFERSTSIALLQLLREAGATRFVMLPSPLLAEAALADPQLQWLAQTLETPYPAMLLATYEAVLQDLAASNGARLIAQDRATQTTPGFTQGRYVRPPTEARAGQPPPEAQIFHMSGEFGLQQLPLLLQGIRAEMDRPEPDAPAAPRPPSPTAQIRVCVIGDSHTAAIKNALVERPELAGGDLAFDIFAAPGSSLAGYRAEGGRLVPDSDELRGWLDRLSPGRSAIDVGAYDIFVLVGLGVSFASTVRMTREDGAHGLAAGAETSDPSPSHLEDRIRDALWGFLADGLLQALRDAGAKRFILIPQPYPAEAALERFGWLRQAADMPRFSELPARHEEVVREAAIAAGVRVLFQDAETRGRPGFTQDRFSKGLTRLRENAEPQRKGELLQMNAEFGAHLLPHLAEAIREEMARPAPLEQAQASVALPDGVTRVCVIGTSHAGALKQALDAQPDLIGDDIVLDFFVADGRRLGGLQARGRTLAAEDDDLQRWLKLTSAGRSVIEVGSYDLFVLVGLIYPFPSTLKIAREQALPEHAEYAVADRYVSAADFDAAVLDGLMGDLLARLVGALRRAGGRRIVLVAPPYPSETMAADPRAAWVRPMMNPNYLAMLQESYEKAARRFAEDLGVEILFQGEATLALPGFTSERFSRGSMRLRAASEPHPEGDFLHMNPDFGAHMLLRIRDWIRDRQESEAAEETVRDEADARPS